IRDTSSLIRGTSSLIRDTSSLIRDTSSLIRDTSSLIWTRKNHVFGKNKAFWPKMAGRARMTAPVSSLHPFPVKARPRDFAA
ncbi:MAG: hypothetical protein ABI318_09325, partial [Chthoniobacteraceae bacterium]